MVFSSRNSREAGFDVALGQKWECMNSVPCTLVASDPPNMGNTEGLCSDALNVSVAAADTTTCVRLWCGFPEWLLPAVAMPLAALLKLLFFRDSKVEPKVEANKQEAAREVEKAEAKAGCRGAWHCFLSWP